VNGISIMSFYAFKSGDRSTPGKQTEKQMGPYWNPLHHSKWAINSLKRTRATKKIDKAQAETPVTKTEGYH
jgi:hypothetical protein